LNGIGYKKTISFQGFRQPPAGKFKKTKKTIRIDDRF
jgi:hypothetical protein